MKIELNHQTSLDMKEIGLNRRAELVMTAAELPEGLGLVLKEVRPSLDPNLLMAAGRDGSIQINLHLPQDPHM